MHHNYYSTDFGDQFLEVALGDGPGIDWTSWDDGPATNGGTWGMLGTDFGDVDNDGDLVLFSISFGAGAGLRLYINQGDGIWVQSFGFLNGNPENLVQFGDFDNDCFLVFICGHQKGLHILVIDPAILRKTTADFLRLVYHFVDWHFGG